MERDISKVQAGRKMSFYQRLILSRDQTSVTKMVVEDYQDNKKIVISQLGIETVKFYHKKYINSKFLFHDIL